MGDKPNHTIQSLPVNRRLHGSKNRTPIRAIGVFELNITEVRDDESITFTFPNLPAKRTEKVIVPVAELKARLSDPDSGMPKTLILWLMPDGKLYNATDIGIEGEWFFIGGGFAANTKFDFTEFLQETK